jgi:hypothetical protein
MQLMELMQLSGRTESKRCGKNDGERERSRNNFLNDTPPWVWWWLSESRPQFRADTNTNSRWITGQF